MRIDGGWAGGGLGGVEVWGLPVAAVSGVCLDGGSASDQRSLVFDSTLHLADLSAEGLGDAITDRRRWKRRRELTTRLVGGMGNLDLVNYRRDDGTSSLPAEFGGTIDAMYQLGVRACAHGHGPGG